MSRYGSILSHLLFASDMVLFTEATEEQVLTIKECLEEFSAASGQKVSLNKSQIYFSNNVNDEEAKNISSIAAMERTQDLGKYLGVPSIHGRITRNMFASLLERIDSRLEGWKTKFLSFAGRQVLAKFVISSIPYYAMQSTLLPEGICDLINKKLGISSGVARTTTSGCTW